MDATKSGKEFMDALGEGLAKADKLAATAAAYSLAQAAVGFGTLARNALAQSEAIAPRAPVQSSLSAAFGHGMLHAAQRTSKAAEHIIGMVDSWTSKTAQSKAGAEAEEAGAHPS